MTSSMPASPKQLNGSADDLLINILFPDSETMNSLSHLAAIQAERQAQHSGYGVKKFHTADGTIKWEAYGWERITELFIHTTSYGLFDQKWEAEQYFNNIVHS